MSDREKLIELIDADEAVEKCVTTPCAECEYENKGCKTGMLADHLISNGVTLQKWIPAGEPPKVKKIEKSCGVVYRKSENVLCSCIVMGGKRMTKPGYLVYINDNPQPQWQIRGDWYSVTHWMPLPEPPKECE